MKIETQNLFYPLRTALDACSGALRQRAAIFSAVLAIGALPSPASAATDTFNNYAGDDSYNNAGNWSTGSVPDLTTLTTALLSAGDNVIYNTNPPSGPGGDLLISNGGVLEIKNGSFTQVGGNNYIQLGQNETTAGVGGTVLIDGGTFNQGTDSAQPFNINNTGNAFTISSGAANISTVFGINTGFTFTQSGGAVNVAGNETDFNNSTSVLSGGMLTTKLITGVNGPSGNYFTVSGGILNLTSSTAGNNAGGIYGGSTAHYVNFTLKSTGSILFSSGTETMSQVMGIINAGGIEINNATATPSNFNIVQDPSTGYITLSLPVAAVPEPSSIVSLALGVAGVAWMLRRRQIRANA